MSGQTGRRVPRERLVLFSQPQSPGPIAGHGLAENPEPCPSNEATVREGHFGYAATRGGSFRGTRRRFGNALRRTRFLQPRRPNPRCESHTRAVPLPGGCEHRTQTPRWRGEGGRRERLGMRKLIAALFVTLDGYGFGEGAPAS